MNEMCGGGDDEALEVEIVGGLSLGAVTRSVKQTANEHPDLDDEFPEMFTHRRRTILWCDWLERSARPQQ